MLHLLLEDCKESIFLCISPLRDSPLLNVLIASYLCLVKAIQQFRYIICLEVGLIYLFLNFIMFKALNLLIKFQVALIVTTDSCWLCNCSLWKKFFWSFWVWFWLQHLICPFPGWFHLSLYFSCIYLPSKPYDKWKTKCLADYVLCDGWEVWCRRRLSLVDIMVYNRFLSLPFLHHCELCTNNNHL